MQGRESVGHARGARCEIDTMQTFEPHHVVHKSFTGLCTTAVLDDSIRCNTSSLEGERSLRRKPEGIRSGEQGEMRSGTSHRAIGP